MNNQIKIIVMQLLGCMSLVGSASAMSRAAKPVLLPAIAAASAIKIPKPNKAWLYYDLEVKDYDNSKPAKKVGRALAHQTLVQTAHSIAWIKNDTLSPKAELLRDGVITVGRPFVFLETHEAVDHPRKNIDISYYSEMEIHGQQGGIIPDCLPVTITTKGRRKWVLVETRVYGQAVDTIRNQLYLLCGPADDLGDKNFSGTIAWSDDEE